MRGTSFSLNLDEATSSSQLHVLTVLASYYNKGQKSIAVEHLASVDVNSVDAASVFEKIKALFPKYDLPWENLLLMDSASSMREEKYVLELRIRELAPHLLDIDGDSCHHMHNIVKNFTLHFGSFLERLLRNLYTDFKHSTNSLESLKDITFHLNLTFRKPSNNIAAR